MVVQSMPTEDIQDTANEVISIMNLRVSAYNLYEMFAGIPLVITPTRRKIVLRS